ncbi:MAG: phosphoenolpyruvate carboxykinase (ATP) [Vicinamibacteria bacterium]
MVVRTGDHTGRAPNNEFVVREPSSEDKVWWGPSNQTLQPERFLALYRRLLAYLHGKNLLRTTPRTSSGIAIHCSRGVRPIPTTSGIESV